MDVVKAVETYVTKIVSVPSAMKVLLLDSHTTPIVSLASTQSSLLSHQVYLTDRIDNRKRDRLPHMKCVCFLQNREESLEALEGELREPKYGEYYLYFSNVLSKTAIERLAEVDEYEVVREVQEYFADYAPLLPSLFSLNHVPSSSRPLYGSSPNSWDPKALERAVDGITAVLLSLKKRPVIRYEKMSGMARKLGLEIQHRIQSESSLFDFRLTQVPPLLLILDRRNDPVTPLLCQWTYQAMVHELLGIQNGRVDLRTVPGIAPELSEVTLTTTTDPFFQEHHLATFGDLGEHLKNYVQSYQSKSLAHAPSSINSIADMKRFVEEYPEFKKLGGNVSKHVALVGELSRLVERDKLLDVGEVEQGLATGSGADMRSVQALITTPSVTAWNKLRLVILYALRYQKSQANNIASLINLMLENGVSREDARLVYVFLNIAGSDQRQDELFSMESLLAKGRSALKGLKGIENVYMQHTPRLSQTLENLFKGRLKETSYPFMEGAGPNAGLQRPQDIIIFMIGGTTYEEARTIALLNQELAAGGGNSTSYIITDGVLTLAHSYVEMIKSAAASFPSSVYEPPPESASSMPALNLNLGSVNTMEDVKVKTRTGAFLTILSAAIILAFTTMEFVDYRRVYVDTSIVVDRSRGEKLTLNMNMTFPKVPCYLLSVDIMDISGETQRDISHSIVKSRLDSSGVRVTGIHSSDLRNEVDKMHETRKDSYCGSCFGADPPEGKECCNTCDDVRQAYVNRGWSFGNPDAIEQCVSEHWTEKLKDQASEGCNVAGRLRVNKVVGNIHLSPGRSFGSLGAANVYDFVPYLRDDGNQHDFSHVIHEFRFAGDDEYDINKAKIGKEMRAKMGLLDQPLDNRVANAPQHKFMFQYFLKIVKTRFVDLNGRTVNTHQYSATHFERDLSQGQRGNTGEGLHIQHGTTGLPGSFFNFEISPILVVHTENRQSFAHFLTSTCAIVGGVLTVASIVDSMLFQASRRLKKSGASPSVNGNGVYGHGKLM
ncbi:Sec1-like protein [Heliocybe sulcata]|uniref:Sec1-like protein n=1 Tax=Heliocybe sulcata TaxID=5364 RepID=A0A5C3N4V3_9AGAM|nr:Sec1-like protein [Heliocybe sulcata]